MGLTYVTVTLKSSKNAKSKYKAIFLVDTGATDSMAPAKALKEAGIKPRGTMSYELADGTLKEFKFGICEIEFMGDLTAGRIIFGPDNCEPILGVTALESTGIYVDSAHQTLKRLPAVPLKTLKS